MNLKDFSLASPVIEVDKVVKAIEAAIPPEAIEKAIAQTNSHECRTRSLPAHLVVCLVIAMNLWSEDSMRAVLKNLIDGLSEAWLKVGQYWRIPCKERDYSSQAEIGAKGNQPAVSFASASNGYT